MIRRMGPAVAIFAALAAVTAASIHYIDKRSECLLWTSNSPAALAELDEALENMERFYWPEAIEHLDRVIELDPEYGPAIVMRLYFEYPGSPAYDELVAALRGAPTEGLNARELFLVRYTLARADKDLELASSELDSFLDRYPEDPWGIMSRCDEAWETEALDEASSCLQRLVELYPNWSMALSRLGLLSMAKGDLQEAEELFQTYRYLAPDQAAPFDSLGQLYALTGRYEAAEEQLLQSIGVKGDFCDARRHLTRLYILWDRLDDARASLEATAALAGCQRLDEWGYFCASRAWLHYLQGDLEAAQESYDANCLEHREGGDRVGHRIALASGDMEAAKAMEKAIESRAEAMAEGENRLLRNFLSGIAFHTRGVRQLAEGQTSKACDSLKKADEISLFWGLDRGNFKLFNQRELVRCLEREQHQIGAELVRRQIQSVNPRYLSESSVPDLLESHKTNPD